MPLLYLDLTRKTSGERTRMFGPFVAVDDPKSSARALFPLWARYKDENETGTYVFPTYFRRRHKDSYKLDSFLPLFWYSRSNTHSTTVVGPFYRSVGPQRSATGLVPLFLHARNAQRRYLLTPLFYDRDNYTDGTGRLFAALLFYRSTRPDGHTTVGFPLFWSGRTGPKRYSVLFPLVWHFSDEKERTSTTLAGPFYSASSQGGANRTRGILPLAWYSRDDEKRTASHALLPLFYEKHGPQQRKLLTLPFGYGSSPESSFWYLVPFVRYQGVSSTFTTVFPLWFSHFDRGTETRTRVIPPLAFFSRTRPDRSLTGLAFLFWRHRDIASATHLVLPLFYDVHNFHENRLTLLAPLFMRYWRASDQTTLHPGAAVLPAIHRGQPRQEQGRGFHHGGLPAVLGLTRAAIAAPRSCFRCSPASAARPTCRATSSPTSTTAAAKAPKRAPGGCSSSRCGNRAPSVPATRCGRCCWACSATSASAATATSRCCSFPSSWKPAPAAQTAWYGRSPPTPARARRERRYGLDTRAW